MRISDSSTWSKGSNRSFSFRCSGDRRKNDPDEDTEEDGDVVGREGDNVGEFWASWKSDMASRMVRIERTTLRRTTARHDARSALKAWDRVKQAQYMLVR